MEQLFEQLYSQTAIKRKVMRLADDVEKCAQAALHVHVIMDGAFMFAADFIRAYGGKISKITFLPVARGYSKGRVHPPRLVHKFPNYFAKFNIDPEHTHLVLDVCIEKGVTLAFVKGLFLSSRVQQLMTCVLLANTKDGIFEADHIGYICTKPVFLTGYGMGPHRDMSAIYGIPR